MTLKKKYSDVIKLAGIALLDKIAQLKDSEKYAFEIVVPLSQIIEVNNCKIIDALLESNLI